jgi:hypothetical protein
LAALRPEKAAKQHTITPLPKKEGRVAHRFSEDDSGERTFSTDSAYSTDSA